MYLHCSFLAEGVSMKEIARNYYLGHSTVHYIIKKTCEAIWKHLLPIYLPEPNREKFMQTANGFLEKWNMPNCIGALDGKHCIIQAPYHSGSEYFSYKKSFG